MPILSGGPLYKDRSKTIEDYQASLGETAGAAFSRAVDTGLSDVALGAAQIATFDFSGGIQNIARPFGIDAAAEINPANRVGAADARKAAEKRGVKLDIADDAYFSPGELDTVLALKKREREQQAVLLRRPKTWAGFGAEMAGGLAGSLVDPVQVAASFIPIVPAARYAAWLEKAGSAGGRAAIRAGVGAAEGFVGSAIVEPFAYGRAQSLGLDYTAQDSFLNLAFGTVLGGGLHVAGGAVGDLMSPSRRAAAGAPEVKSREALATAVTALDDGRALDVDPVFRDPRMNAANDTAFMARELNRAPDILEADISKALGDLKAVRAGQAERAPDLIDAIKSLGGIKITDAQGRITSEGGDVRDIFNRRYPVGLVNNKAGVPLDYVREALQEQGWLPKAGDGTNETTTADVLDMLSQWNGGKKPMPIGEVRGEDLSALPSEMKAAGITKSDNDEVASFKLAKHRAEAAMRDAPELIREPSIQPDSYDPSTGYEPPEMERVRLEADEAVARGDTDDIDGEIEALNEMLAMAEKREPLNEFDRAALDLADAFETKSRISADSYRAAASCLSGLA